MNRRKFIKPVSMTWAAFALLPGCFHALAEKVKEGVKIKFRSRNDLGGNIGTDPMWTLTSNTGLKPTSAQPKMKLTKKLDVQTGVRQNGMGVMCKVYGLRWRV